MHNYEHTLSRQMHTRVHPLTAHQDGGWGPEYVDALMNTAFSMGKSTHFLRFITCVISSSVDCLLS
jgi:hypothetical protein